jgi:hypothetical protein
MPGPVLPEPTLLPVLGQAVHGRRRCVRMGRTGGAGTASRWLVMYPGNLLLCPRQGGGRSRDPLAQLPRAFELFAGIKYLAVQTPGAFRRRPIDLGLLPPDKRGSAFERGLAAVKALPAF